MDPYLLLILIALLYTLLFGLSSLLRREGLSLQFALEALALSTVLIGGAWLLGRPLNPILFLALLYLATMRSRLLVEAANLLAGRRSFGAAFQIYRLALILRPDDASRLVVLTNLGAAQLLAGDAKTATATLEEVLAGEARGRLGFKYEAACRYNLGLAYRRAGQETRAVQQFQQVVEMLPGSVWGRAAQAALKEKRPA